MLLTITGNLQKKNQQILSLNTSNGGLNDSQTLGTKALSSTESENPSGSPGMIVQVPIQKDESRFKITSFDELTNPLRADHPFGKITLPPYFLIY
jgi:hypothetical protein